MGTHDNVSPTVTVVIPTYNRSDVLPRALESVLGQTFGDFEVLVVDDGSTDDTAGVMTEYVERDGRIRYLVQPENVGVSAARNRGIREARGEFIAFLDSDDEWMPAKLDRQVKQLRVAPQHVALSYTGVLSIFDDGTTQVDKPRHRGHVYKEMLQKNVLHGGGSGVMIRKEAICKVGCFREDISVSEDYDVWLRVAKQYDVAFIEEPLLTYYDDREGDRLSRNIEKRIEARDIIYCLYGKDMHRYGLAYGYLVHTVQLRMRMDRPDYGTIRRLCIKAIAKKPISRTSYRYLAQSLVGSFRKMTV